MSETPCTHNQHLQELNSATEVERSRGKKDSFFKLNKEKGTATDLVLSPESLKKQLSLVCSGVWGSCLHNTNNSTMSDQVLTSS